MTRPVFTCNTGQDHNTDLNSNNRPWHFICAKAGKEYKMPLSTIMNGPQRKACFAKEIGILHHKRMFISYYTRICGISLDYGIVICAHKPDTDVLLDR